MQWLQSNNQAEVFDRLFVRVSPECVAKLSPLVNLSTAAAVTASLESHLPERLTWLANVFGCLDIRVRLHHLVYASLANSFQDPDLREVFPKVVSVLNNRLQNAYMELAHSEPGNPNLRTLYALYKESSQLTS